METTITDEHIKSFEEMPTLEVVPDDYVLNMPTYLAAQSQKLGPIFRRKLPQEQWAVFGKWIVYMIGPEANKFVLNTHRDLFSHDKGWTPTLGGIFYKGLLNTDDPEHAKHRKMMNPAFAVVYMNRYLPIMRRVIEERTSDWAKQKEVDVYQECRKITFDVAAESLAGFKTGPEVDKLRELFYALMFADFNPKTETIEQFYQKYYAIRDNLNRMLLEMVNERRKNPTDDILGTLVTAQDEDGETFTDEQILGQLHILLVAGHETTTTMSAWLLYLLATNPDYLARVHAELDEILAETGGEITLEATKSMKVLGNAVDEAGRLHSPAGNVPRGVVKDFEFGGYQVPEGTRVALSLAACHRLPNIFANPDKFDPDRFAAPREEDRKNPYSLVTFGGGPRICIGMNFALVEMKALAAHVLQKFSFAPASPDQEIMHVYYSPVAAILGGIPLKVTAR